MDKHSEWAEMMSRVIACRAAARGNNLTEDEADQCENLAHGCPNCPYERDKAPTGQQSERSAPAGRAVGKATAARDVLAERRRQMTAEGWMPEHDDEHADGSMSIAAACYILKGIGRALPGQLNVVWLWKWTGWADAWFKPRDRRRNLVKAGALILAEIERLDRLASSQAEQGGTP